MFFVATRTFVYVEIVRAASTKSVEIGKEYRMGVVVIEGLLPSRLKTAISAPLLCENTVLAGRAQEEVFRMVLVLLIFAGLLRVGCNGHAVHFGSYFVN